MTTDNLQVREHIFSNGLTVVTERMPHVRSTAVGLWLRDGSRAEPAELNGISHFIEHMVFKGTERRTAEEIARESDRIGGMLDAFTSKEMTCFQMRVIDEHLPKAFDLLSDLYLRPLFLAEEIEREKGVIIEEIGMVQDNPEDLVHENFSQNFWPGHSLARPILGTPETVRALTRETVENWFRKRYTPGNLLITAAGNLTHEQMLDLAGAAFSDLPRGAEKPATTLPQSKPHITLRTKRELEQVHICLGVPAFPLIDPRRFAVSVLNIVLGTGMSSRLFQNIREKQGLAYAVFSDINPYRDAGLLSVYAGTSLDSAEKLVRSVMAEFQAIRDYLITEEELQRAKDNLKGATLLALESSGTRMSRLARQFLYFDRFVSTEDLLAQLDAVTREQVQQVAREFFHPGQISASVLGNLNGFRLSPEELTC
jgi:predicted Zn-dependent peptidase